MSTYRTLREAEALRDFTKALREIHHAKTSRGPLDPEYGNGAGILLWGVVGAVVLWIFLLLVLG